MKQLLSILSLAAGWLFLASPAWAGQPVTTFTDIALGQAVSGNLTGAPSQLTDYTLYYGYPSGSSYTTSNAGPERVYRLVLAKEGYISFPYSYNSNFVYRLLRAPNTSQGFEHVGNSTYLPAGTYYLVVEQGSAAAGATYSFTLSSHTSDANQDYYPSNPVPFACGQTVTGNLAGQANHIDGYNDFDNGPNYYYHPYYAASGPDRQYAFTMPTPGYVFLRKTKASSHQLYLLSDSTNGKGIGLAAYYGYNPFPDYYYLPVPAGRYYVSVEGNDPNEAFGFALTCGAANFGPYQNVTPLGTLSLPGHATGTLSSDHAEVYNLQYGTTFEVGADVAYTLAPTTNGRLSVRSTTYTGQRLFLMDSTLTSTVLYDPNNYGATARFPDQLDITLYGGNNYTLSIEQGSATTAGAYDFKLNYFCIPATQVTYDYILSSFNLGGLGYDNRYHNTSYVFLPLSEYYNSRPTFLLQSGINTPASLASNGANVYGAIWIDLNDDGDFNDADEFAYGSTTLGTSLSGNVLLNASSPAVQAAVGKTVAMRIRTRSTVMGSADACTGGGTGQTVDLDVTIQAPPPPNGHVPTITSFSPMATAENQSVTVNGHYFSNLQSVKMGTLNCNVGSYTDSTLTFTVPTGAVSNPITITTYYGTVASATPLHIYTYVYLYSVSPAYSCVGDSITVTGKGFTDVNHVYGDYPSNASLGFRIVNDSVIRAKSVAASYTGTLYLDKPFYGTWKTQVYFTVAPPVITGVAQLLVNGNYQVTLTGMGSYTYGPPIPNSIKLNGTAIAGMNVTYTDFYPVNGTPHFEIRFTVPASTSGGTFTIANVCGTSAPSLQAFYPTLKNSYQWARTAGGIGTDRFNRVRLDPYGNVYAAGAYSGTASIQAGSGTSPSYTAAGSTDGVLVRYNRSGALQWVFRIASTGDDEVLGLATDKFGYAYVTGYFSGTASLIQAAGTVAQTLVSAGGRDMFVAKVHPDGHLVYAFRMGDTGDDRADGIDVAADLRFFVAGSFRGTTNIRGISGSNQAFTSVGNYDAFVARFSDIGTLYFAYQIGGPGNDFAYGVAAGSNGGGYVMGSFESTCKFNTYAYGCGDCNSRTAVGGSDGYVAAFSTSNITWIQTIGGQLNENVRDVAPDPRGTGVVAVGGFSGTTTFGTLGSRTSIGFYDAFAMRLSSAGAFEWVSQAGSIGQDQAYGVRLDRNGHPWVGLSYAGSVTKTFTTLNDTTSAPTSADGMLVQLDAASGLLRQKAKVLGLQDQVVLGVDTTDGLGALAAGSYAGTLRVGALPPYAAAGGNDAWVARFSAALSGPQSANSAAREEEDGLVFNPSAAMRAMPNPTAGSYTLQAPGLAEGSYRLSVNTSDGRQAQSLVLTAQELAQGKQLENSLPPGIYLLRLTGREGVVAALRLVKE